MLKDKTAELSFTRVNDECVEQLLGGSRVVVVKNCLPLEAETGVAKAYHAARRRMLHRRLASRALATLGLEDGLLYVKSLPDDVKANPYMLPRHKASAQNAVSALLDVHDQFTEHPKVVETYKGALEQNLALFALARGERAFPMHQDNQGKAGIAEAAQFQPTRWTIHKVIEAGLALPEYTFETAAGDVVVLAERRGPAPIEPPVFRTGEHTFYADGSPVHSGQNLGSVARYGLGLFNEQVPEIR